MARVLDSVIGTFEDLETASGNGLNPAQFASARAELSKMSGQLETIERNVNRSSDAQKGLNREIRGGSVAADGLAGKVKSLIAAYAGVQTLGKAVGLSDSVSSMSARLSVLGGDAQETEKKVMACANRSRSAFLDTADAVAKLGTNAGEAFGNDIDQIIGFSELVGKQFVLSGATAQEQSAAMLQLTQAMASGVLRGDELNSIFEQAPGLIQRIADYLGVSIGEIRGLASKGAITADVIKNAMFGAADEINQKFEEMPKTWGQIWTLAGNRLLEAFRPALDRFSELINSDGFTAVWDGLIGGIGSFVTRTTTALGSEGFVKGLRDALYSHIQRLPYSWHVKNQTGDIIQRCTSDVEVIRNFFTNQLLEVIRIVFMIVYYLCIMFSMNWTIALISAVFIPIVVLYSMIFYSKINVRFRAADEAEGVLSTAVQENLTGVRVVRAFGRERWEVDRFNEKNRRFSNLWVELGKLMSVYWALGDLITGLQIMAVIAVGAGFAATGRISLGTLLAFISYNSALTWPIRSLGRTLSEMSKSGVSIDRVAYILKAEEEKILPNAETPPMNRDIEFKDVTFSYEGQKPVLNHLSFTIPAGKTFAILGGTGSGKSTIAAL